MDGLEAGFFMVEVNITNQPSGFSSQKNAASLPGMNNNTHIPLEAFTQILDSARWKESMSMRTLVMNL